jgi:alpha-galactosidase
VSAITVSEQKESLSISNHLIKLTIQIKTGRLSITRPDASYPRIHDALVGVGCRWEKRGAVFPFGTGAMSFTEGAVTDVHGKGRGLVVTDSEREDGLVMRLTVRLYETRPFLLLRLSVENACGRTFFLDDLTLVGASFQTGGRVEFGREPAPLDFLKVGWHDWCYTGLLTARDRDVSTMLGHWVGKMYFNPTTPIPLRRGDFWGEGWGVLTDAKSAIVAGFASTADQFGQVHVNCNPKKESLTLVAGADGIPLDAGEEFTSEWGYIEFVDLPNPDPAAEYVQTVARFMKPRLKKVPPPAKWTHWYHYFHDITEDLFVQNLEVIDRIKKTVPFHTVQLDDGYQPAWGDWYTPNEKFPNGLKYLAGRIREKGFVPGLWLAPFVADPKSRLAREHPDWLVKDRRGKPIVGGFFWNFFGNVLDLTNPAVLDWLRELMRTATKEWGFGFIKTDFVYSGALPGVRNDPKQTRAQAFRRGMEAIREGLGEDTYHLGCGCPFGPSIGIVDAMRIGPDTAPSWNPFLMNMRWASPLITREKGIPSLRNNIRHTINLSTINERWWTSDPDCLMVRDFDTALTDDEVKSNVSLIGLSGGLVINSDDLTRLTPERQRLISILLPIMGRRAGAVDLLEREMAETYVLDMERKWGKWIMAARFNWGRKTATKTIDIGRLNLDPDGEYHVFDFWNRRYRVHTGRELELADIPAHGCRLLRIAKNDGKPTVVGGTFHITCGGEVEGVTVTKKGATFTIGALGRSAEGELWVWLPGQITSATVGKKNIPVVKRTDNVWALNLSIKGKTSVSVTWHE